MHVIVYKRTGLWWSNETGWVGDLPSATRFNDEEHESFNLPIGGRWVKCGPTSIKVLIY